MSAEKRYKPLWMIHNRTYRVLAREARSKRLALYRQKAQKMLQFMMRKRGKSQ